MLAKRFIAALGLAISLFVGTIAGATPALSADVWMVARASGTVLYLTNGKWQELTPSTTLSGEQVVRTMAGAGLRLTLDPVTLELGGGTALQISEGGIAQFSGRLTAAVTSGPGLRISTGVLSAVLQGTATVSFSGDVVRYSVRSGSVTIADSVHGTVLQLGGGEQVAASSASGIAPESGDGTAVAGRANANASVNSNGAGSDNASANANDAASGNSSAAGNSNAGGNGNGNSGGSGNSGENGNAGGNGNGNGGENGNAGGNGNGNGT